MSRSNQEQIDHDQARINYIGRGPDPRTDFAPTTFQSNVLWLLCFIATKLNK